MATDLYGSSAKRNAVAAAGQGDNSIRLKKRPKRPEKGPESKFATSICMNSEKGPDLQG